MTVFKRLFRYRAWIILTLVLLFVAVVRVRLRAMPLERDEGEYAYSGQLLLQGIAPYKLAYNMKFPGIYAAYALLMLLFGQTVSGIHLGLLAINLASIILMFFLGRKLLDVNGGLIAATSYAVLSMSESVLGLAGHASHFVVLAAFAGTLLLLRIERGSKPMLYFLSGLCFGIAFLMKQPGVFWGIFGLLYLVWSGVAVHRKAWKEIITKSVWYGSGLAMPFILLCLVLMICGVWDRFVFWTFTYAHEYVALHPLFSISTEQFRDTFGQVFGSNPLFWIVVVLGLVTMWWDESLRPVRWFIAGFVVFSVMAVCPGWYFRQHYFVLLLPAASLLAAVAVNRSIYLVQHDRTIELLLAVCILAMFPLAVGVALVGNGSVWFEMSPVAACRHVYLAQMFSESADLAEYIKEHSSPEARIAVLGSEPEIYFDARRHSATGYIYAYPLVEQHQHASKMQSDMIQEIEAAKPEFLVFINVKESWLTQPESQHKIFTWYEEYTKTNYNLVKMLHENVDKSGEEDPRLRDRAPGYLLLYERINPGKKTVP
jgi:hypothetical protein